jgi:Heavy metal binding domain
MKGLHGMHPILLAFALLAVACASDSGHDRIPHDAPAAPRTNTDMRTIQPASTLKPDAFDTPAPVSVAEAEKARRAAATQAADHSQHGGAQAAVVYTCPMHPEVTSDKPGTCPKCGMDLVKKN